MIVYDFKIFYKLKKINFANKLSKRSNYEKTLTLNIKFLLSLQNKFALSKNMRDSLKIFNNVFKIINVQKFEFALNARNLKKKFENALIKLNIQRLTSSLKAKNSKEMFKRMSTRSSVQKFKFSINI